MQTPLPFPRIELAEGYFLESYFGWKLEARTATWKLWKRRVGPAHRRLLISDGASHAELREALGNGLALAGTLWNDFSDLSCATSLSLGRRRFVRSESDVRWFGVGTYVFDLSLTDDELLARVQSRTRSKIRSTKRAGFRADFLERPKRSELEPFLARYHRMNAERGLAPLDLLALERMLTNRDAVLARAIDPQGTPRTWNIIYLTKAHGYYLHGVHDDSAEDAAGHLLHMETLSYVRSRGRSFYDFGLVGSSDQNEGIHRFKRSLGGTFVPSGTERSEASWLRDRIVPWARATRDRMRRLLVNIPRQSRGLSICEPLGAA